MPVTRNKRNQEAEIQSIRLVGGMNRCAGRVEIYYNNTWGTVCDDGWGFSNADVLCRQIQCGSPITLLTASFGPGTGNILMDDVGCTGREESLWTCSFPGWGKHNCAHNEDVGVVCSEIQSIRLVGGVKRCAGRVEVYYNNTWGTVCDDGWGVSNAAVVCRQMQCGSPVTLLTPSFGAGSGNILMDDVICTGHEVSLWTCSFPGWGRHNCAHSEDVGVVCAEIQSIRLVGGVNKCAGRVEVYYNNTWGTVCDDGWGATNAEVVCRQMQCGSPVTSLTPSFGAGSGNILMDDVTCTGHEVSLWTCSFPGWGKHNCAHSEDVGVVCSEIQSIRLVGGVNRCSGRVEVYYNNTWGTVCDDGWGATNAEVVCREMQCGSPVTSLTPSFGAGSGNILMDDVTCTGHEKSLWTCSFLGWGRHNCAHSEDVGVVCSGEPVTWGTWQRCGTRSVYMGISYMSLADTHFGWLVTGSYNDHNFQYHTVSNLHGGPYVTVQKSNLSVL
ncbi:scavenger receptor cysteine-rich domain-containing protein DMBT1-like [Rhinophrynus dorsalis]